MDKKYRHLKTACYSVNLSMAIVGNLPPVLFLTFRSMYGISYSLLGLLVLVNFFTQLIVDLIFSFFSYRFNISKAVKSMPYMTFAGLLIYALWPMLSPETAYIGLVLGTVVFSASAGFAEVLISPVIASIPSDDPDREMSKLHSVYAWGAVAVVIVSTVFLLVFGSDNWYWLAMACLVVPVFSAVMFYGTKIPEMDNIEKVSGAIELMKKKELWLCVAAIFLGGSAECTMAQWSSSYLEMAAGIPKIWGDILGVALFSTMLGLGRSLYAKYGKNISKVLLACGIGATLCYFAAAVSAYPVVGLIACALTGLCTSMMWPGSLVVASDRFPSGGVFIYAMMAAGGDMGASIGPQLVGFITDMAMANPILTDMAQNMALSPDQFGMKLGMLAGMFFPLCSIPLFFSLWRKSKKCVDN